MNRSAVKYLVATLSLGAALAVASPLYAADKAAASASSASSTNTDMQILKDKIKADKKLLVAGNLTLSDEEAKAFWPIYDAYQKDLAATNKRIGAAVMKYADEYNTGAITEEVATKLINESIDIDASEVQMRKNYAAKLVKALPAWKAARYLQIESKIRAAVRYELAAQIPLME